MFSKIYVRGIVGIITIGGMVCYLGTADGLTEIAGAIVAIVYIDSKLNENK
jgi:hypothetical protein